MPASVVPARWHCRGCLIWEATCVLASSRAKGRSAGWPGFLAVEHDLIPRQSAWIFQCRNFRPGRSLALPTRSSRLVQNGSRGRGNSRLGRSLALPTLALPTPSRGRGYVQCTDYLKKWYNICTFFPVRNEDCQIGMLRRRGLSRQLREWMFFDKSVENETWGARVASDEARFCSGLRLGCGGQSAREKIARGLFSTGMAIGIPSPVGVVFRRDF